MLLFVGLFLISLAGMFRRSMTGDSNDGIGGIGIGGIGVGGGRYQGYNRIYANLDYRPVETLDYQLRSEIQPRERER